MPEDAAALNRIAALPSSCRLTVWHLSGCLLVTDLKLNEKDILREWISIRNGSSRAESRVVPKFVID
jgi:hypothetical protein